MDHWQLPLVYIYICGERPLRCGSQNMILFGPRVLAVEADPRVGFLD